MSAIVEAVGGMENVWLGVVGLLVNVTVFVLARYWYRRVDGEDMGS